MALVVGDSTEVSAANLNKLFAFDAVVDAAAGGNTGSIYTTVDAAIDAGHKSIFVKEGSYAGFNADVNGLRIVGENRADVAHTYGVRFSSGIAVSGAYVHLENLSVKDSSGYGISVEGQYATFVRCQVISSTSHGIFLDNNTDGATLIDCRSSGNVINLRIDDDEVTVIGGIYDDGSGDGIELTGDSGRIIGVHANGNAGYGIDISGIAGRAIVNDSIVYGNTLGQINGSKTGDDNVVA